MDKLNRLEQAIANAEASAEDARWAQAEEVCRLLDSGKSERDVAKSWLRGVDGPYGKAGEPYSRYHVRTVAAMWRGHHGAQSKPLFSRAYEQAKGQTTRPEQAQAQAPKTPEAAERLVENLQDAPPAVIETIYQGVRETRENRYRSPAVRERARQEASVSTERTVEPIKRAVGGFSGEMVAELLDEAREGLTSAMELGIPSDVLKRIEEAHTRFGHELEVARGIGELKEVVG